ncbi:MAG: rhodanese-like domain-containing protein [Armatimonadota bacterium]
MIILIAVLIGITSNKMRAESLPLIKEPISKSREMAQFDNIIDDTKNNVTKNKDNKDIEKKVIPKDSKLDIDFEKNNIDKENKKVNETKDIDKISEKKPQEKKQEISKPTKQEITEAPVQALFISLEDAKKIYDSGNAIFLDARIIDEYKEEHISGAISLDTNKIEELYNQILGNIDKNKLIVTYCSDIECGSAIELADKLVLKGHKKVVIMIQGIPAWIEAGYPTTKE